MTVIVNIRNPKKRKRSIRKTSRDRVVVVDEEVVGVGMHLPTRLGLETIGTTVIMTVGRTEKEIRDVIVIVATKIAEIGPKMMIRKVAGIEKKK